MSFEAQIKNVITRPNIFFCMQDAALPLVLNFFISLDDGLRNYVCT